MKKICSKCKTEKAINEFCKNKTTLDGYSGYCKVCKKQFAREHYLRHKAEIIQKAKIYSENPDVKEKIVARRKEYYERNKETFSRKGKIYNRKPEVKERKKKQSKLWAEKNRDALKQYQKDYRQKNLDRDRAKNRERKQRFYAMYPEKIKERGKKYRKSPLGLVATKRNYVKRRYINKIFTDITAGWLNELYKKSTHCELCNVELNDAGNVYPNGKHLDHILPLNAGGAHMKNNVRFICFKCNVQRPKDGSDNLKLVI